MLDAESLRQIAVAVCLRIQMRILLRQVEQEVKTRQLGRCRASSPRIRTTRAVMAAEGLLRQLAAVLPTLKPE